MELRDITNRWVSILILKYNLLIIKNLLIMSLGMLDIDFMNVLTSLVTAIVSLDEISSPKIFFFPFTRFVEVDIESYVSVFAKWKSFADVTVERNFIQTFLNFIENSRKREHTDRSIRFLERNVLYVSLMIVFMQLYNVCARVVMMIKVLNCFFVEPIILL